MQKLSDGSMTPGSVPADSLVRIIEDESLKGTGTWTTTVDEADKKSPLYNWTLFSSDSNKYVRQTFRVPVGTVVQTFRSSSQYGCRRSHSGENGGSCSEAAVPHFFFYGLILIYIV